MYQAKGDYAAALPLLKRALEINERVLKNNHPNTAASLIQLATLYQAQGDYVAALPLLVRGVEIMERAQGKDHPDTAKSLNSLALFYQTEGNYTAALPLFKRALEINEKVFGRHHPSIATGLNNLACVYQAQRDYSAALPVAKRALEIWEKPLGKDHPETATGLNNLACIYSQMGEYPSALPLLLRALEIMEKAQGKDNPETAKGFHNLAVLYRVQADFTAALPLFQRALEISRKNLEAAGAVQAERQQLAMTGSVRTYTDSYLSCLAASDKGLAEAYPDLLMGKGSVFLRQQWARLARTTGDQETLRVLKELQSASSRLATLAFGAPPSQERAAWKRQIAEAGAEKERLEGELSGLSAAFRQEQSQRKRGVSEIQAVLPGNSALVDLVEYTHSTPPAKKGDKWTFERRLLAFLVRQNGPVKAIELQAVAPIAAAVEKWRETLGNPRGDGTDPGRRLRELVWEKIEPELGDAKTVLISPDGVLAKIPWSALPGKRPGSYLLEERAIVVVPVPQALPELLAATPMDQETPPSLLCVGDVDYGAAPGKTALELASRAAATSTVGRPEFSRLAGTGPEAARIKAIFEQRYAGAATKYLQGNAASKESFRTEAAQHRWLHLATHGFFADPKLRSVFQSDEKQQARQFMSFDQQRGAVGWDPGLLSGLALAGASRAPGDGEEDGILTASEVASMNLSRVELAVLSACETGLGETAGGEGILGMQRAFQVAGAKNVVASLWKVDDTATQALMTEFYANLWQKKLPPIEALRQAQLKMLVAYQPSAGKLRAGFEDRPFNDNALPKLKPGETRLPPFYWAAFVLSGAGK